MTNLFLYTVTTNDAEWYLPIVAQQAASGNLAGYVDAENHWSRKCLGLSAMDAEDVAPTATFRGMTYSLGQSDEFADDQPLYIDEIVGAATYTATHPGTYRMARDGAPCRVSRDSGHILSIQFERNEHGVINGYSYATFGPDGEVITVDGGTIEESTADATLEMLAESLTEWMDGGQM